jgi:hypothetical protein
MAGLAIDSDEPGTVIGRYRLIEQIGGGQSFAVFLAQQIEPWP